MAKGKGKAAEEEAETPEQAERLALQLEAERLHKISKREEQDFNEFQQQREKINYFWIVEKKKVEGKTIIILLLLLLLLTTIIIIR